MYYAQLTTGPPSSAPATTAAAMSLFRMGVLVAASSFAVDMAIGWDWALCSAVAKSVQVLEDPPIS